MGKLADFFMMSCLWTFCCFGVVTIGASCIALYDVTAHCIRNGEGAMFRRFLHTLKREFQPGLRMTLFWGVIGLILALSHQCIALLGVSDPVWNAVAIVFFFLLTVPIGILSWAIALQSRFTYGFWELHKNAMLMAIAYLPRTFGIVALFVIALNLCLMIPFAVMVVPCVMTTAQSSLIEPVLKKYTPTADAEKVPDAEASL